jgi:hypothetical protein
MAFSPTDPVFAHSLWLQLRSPRRKTRRTQWRRDWTPLWLVFLLISMLVFFSMLFSPIDSFERAERTAQNETILQPAVVGALAEP